MATYSFDSIKVWDVDFNSQQKKLKMGLKQTIKQTNVLSMLILPGSKYFVMGTKDGDLMLYDLNESSFCQAIDSAHKKEIWELAMHTNPQIKNSKG
jgi:WD40 repeat protein